MNTLNVYYVGNFIGREGEEEERIKARGKTISFRARRRFPSNLLNFLFLPRGTKWWNRNIFDEKRLLFVLIEPTIVLHEVTGTAVDFFFRKGC